jgi:hypothetical protein
MKDKLVKHYLYHLAVNETDNTDLEDLFEITPNEGIIYLDKPERLSMLKSDSMITLNVLAQNDSSEVPILLAVIKVNVLLLNDSTHAASYHGRH